ncbi:MAG: NAD(P)-dependent oxidoreductase [Candidatus Omnitrophica bacterium]|nr:NAD(P)-dependent oxidoreductase [Candidatus Omnitrophota bacterium]
MRKRVLITGASGFVGSALIEYLASKDWDIIPLVRRESGLKDEVIMDFCDPNISLKINSLPEVDTIIHLGVKADFEATIEELFIPNVFATECLVKWASNIKAHFIFASATIVCGAKTNLITSKSVPSADIGYGHSKLLAEQKIKESKVEYTILRVGGIFGKNGPNHLGINRTISGALVGDVPIQYGLGEIKRNYIYVKDLAEIIYFCMENKKEGTHLVAGTEASSMSAMLQTICNVFLPGKNIINTGIENGSDQIVEHSMHLPKGRSFEEAILDIKKCA